MAAMEDDYQHAELPSDQKGTRACLRCSLIKHFDQFYNNGCENCEFLRMEGDTTRVHECTTAYFEGCIAMLEPNGSWVARWQRIGNFVPGLYAIDVIGQLPDDALEYCDNNQMEHRAAVKAAK